MKLGDFQTGLVILRGHFNNPDGYYIGSEHDQFFVYKTDTPLDKEELAWMGAHGWFQEDIGEDDPYDPEEGWTCYV